MNLKLKSALFLSLAFAAASAQTMDAGIRALQNENYETARNIFLSLTKADALNADNFYQLGQAYCWLGKNDSARMAFQKGIVANEKSAACYVGLGKTYLNENNVAEAGKNFDKAKTLYSQKDIRVPMMVAEAYTNATHNNPTEAVSRLKGTFEITTKNPEVYFGLAEAYLALNEGGNAVSNYEFSFEYGAKFTAVAKTKIGIIWKRAQNYKESLSSLTGAIAYDSTFAPAWRELAELYMSTAQYDKAAKAIAQYEKYSDKNCKTTYRIAQIKFMGKNYQESLDLLKQVMNCLGSELLIHRLIGYADFETGNYNEGLEEMKKFFADEPADKIIETDYEYLAKIYQKLGNDSMALKNYELAFLMDTTKCDLIGEAAAIYWKKKDYARAAASYERKVGCAKNPDFKDIVKIGQAYYYDSQYVKSDSAFARVNRIVPKWHQTWLWRARGAFQLEKDSIIGLAEVYYDSVIVYASLVSGQPDTLKNKKDLLEAYKYLVSLYSAFYDQEKLIFYLQKWSWNDPENKDAKALLEEEMKKPKQKKPDAPK